MHIAAPDGVAPGNGYTNVVTGTGRLIAVSGQVAPPASTAVAVAALFRPEFLVEIEALALVPA